MSSEQFDIVRADQLMADLLSSPEAVEKRGSANELLKQFFRGYPLDKLRSLLHHQDGKVIRAGIWIASELGTKAAIFLDEAIAALDYPDEHIRHSALDVIMLGTTDERKKDFLHIVRRLDDPSIAVRKKALRLLSHATNEQLAAALKLLELDDFSSPHFAMLRLLLRAQLNNPSDVEEMVQSDDRLRNQYGVAIAERLYGVYPHLLKLAANGKDDESRSVAEHMLRLHKI